MFFSFVLAGGDGGHDLVFDIKSRLGRKMKQSYQYDMNHQSSFTLLFLDGCSGLDWAASLVDH
jgi:hypothetical protein